MRRGAPRRRPIRIPGPDATERRIEDNVMIAEGVIDVTRALEARCRLRPLTRIGGRGCDVGRGGGMWEVPDGDVRGGPLHGVNAAAVGVETRAVGGGERVIHRAAHVLRLPRGVQVAARVDDLGCRGEVTRVVADIARWAAGMQCHEIRALAIHPLDDIDFPIGGPGVRFRGPERGPGAAGAGRHVGEVEDDEGVRVGLEALHAEGGAAGGRGRGGAVDAHVNFPIGEGFEEAGLLSGGAVEVGHVALGGVGDGLEREGGEPVGGGVVVLGGVGAEDGVQEREGADDEGC